jgi:hypothetical protein
VLVAGLGLPLEVAGGAVVLDRVVDRPRDPVGVELGELVGVGAEVAVEGVALGGGHPAGPGDQGTHVAPGQDPGLEQPGDGGHRGEPVGGGQDHRDVGPGCTGVEAEGPVHAHALLGGGTAAIEPAGQRDGVGGEPVHRGQGVGQTRELTRGLPWTGIGGHDRRDRRVELLFDRWWQHRLGTAARIPAGAARVPVGAVRVPVGAAWAVAGAPFTRVFKPVERWAVQQPVQLRAGAGTRRGARASGRVLEHRGGGEVHAQHHARGL